MRALRSARRAGDRLGEILILLAGGAADGRDLDQFGLGEIKLTLLGIGFAEILVSVDIVGVDGERSLVEGEARAPRDRRLPLG
jgi:hypothetical protein